MLTHRKVEVFLFRKTKKCYQFLLLKRTKKSGSFWQPITGRVEEHESIIHAAKREIFEETGIKKIKKLTREVYSFTLKKKPYPQEHVFGAEAAKSVKVSLDKNICKEHDRYKWVPYKEAIKLLKWRENKKGLNKLHEILNQMFFIIIRGPAGVGKSTIAKELSKILKAKEKLDKNIPIIFDGCFYRKKQLVHLIKNLQYKCYIFSLNAPVGVCFKRNKTRSRALPKKAVHKVHVLASKNKHGIIIETNNKTEKQIIKEILSYFPHPSYSPANKKKSSKSTSPSLSKSPLISFALK